MRLTAGKLSFDGLAGFQRKLFIGALRRAASAIACLRCQRIRRRPCGDWQSDPGEQDDYENGGGGGFGTPPLRGWKWGEVVLNSDSSLENSFPSHSQKKSATF